jgi:hypothetical protein
VHTNLSETSPFLSAQTELSRVILQLNKCETGPYFFQNFQCTTMFISAYCKICELNIERESVFAVDVSGVSLESQLQIFLEQFQVHKWVRSSYKTRK